MLRLNRCADTSPARDRIERCEDMVFCGTAIALAISPAASPSGSCLTNNRNTSSRVDCASAASARMTCSGSIYRELWIYGCLSTRFVHRPCLSGHQRGGKPGDQLDEIGLAAGAGFLEQAADVRLDRGVGAAKGGCDLGNTADVDDGKEQAQLRRS